MNELSRYLQILGLQAGASPEEARKVYRELVMVWHPDRFAADSPLQIKAQEKTKEINEAYAYVMEHGFVEGNPVVSETSEPEPESAPAPDPEGEAPTPEPAGKHSWRLWVLFALVAFGAVGAWIWPRLHRVHKPGDDLASIDATNVSLASTSTVNVGIHAAANSPEPTNSGLGPAVEPVSLPPLQALGCTPQKRADGTVIIQTGMLVTEEEYAPPFTLRVIAQTDTTNIRLRYGRGMLIFNWEANPGELRYHDIRDGHAVAVAGEGKVDANAWHTMEWVVETNGCAIWVNGRKRAEFTGDYQGFNDLAGIESCHGANVSVRHFSVKRRGPSIAARPPNLTSNLALYFTFDELRGTEVPDASPFRNKGTARGVTAVPDGKIGGAFEFRGGTNLVTVPHSPSLIDMQRTREFTLAVWLKPRSLTGEFPVVVCKGSERFKAGYELLLNSHGDHDLIFKSGVYNLQTSRAGGRWINKRLGEWVHVALVINERTSSRKWYINGRRTGDELDNDFGQLNFALAVPLSIGAPLAANHSNRGQFDGLMDELRIYARALTSDEIRSLPGLR